MKRLDSTEKYKNKFSNVYEATCMLSRNARRRSESCSNVIVGSDAIDWELTGIEPSDIAERLHQLDPNVQIEKFIDKYTNTINDENVSMSIKQSIKKSLEKKHLVYLYNNIEDASKSRIRIICNMIWEDILRL